MGKLIEGLWDCQYCNTKAIRGSLRECPNCGKPRDEDTRFYMPSAIQYVSEEEEKKINRNPDWICQYCDCLNSDSDTICKSCGSERTSENLDYFSNKKKKSQKFDESFVSASQDSSLYDSAKEEDEEYYNSSSNFSSLYGNDTKENDDSYYNENGFLHSAKKLIIENWKKLLMILSVIALIAGIVCLFIPRTEVITVNDFKWERNIDIEELRTVNESDWYLPSNARLKYTRAEISRYENVVDHYERESRQVAKQRIARYEEYVSGHRDLGNGYFEEIKSRRPIYETYYETEYYDKPIYRQEPVYQIKYYYEIDKWFFKRNIKTQGMNKDPYWGEFVLNGNERVSTKKESYYIIATDKKGKIKEILVKYETWNDLKTGQSVKMKKSIFGYGEVVE